MQRSSGTVPFWQHHIRNRTQRDNRAHQHKPVSVPGYPGLRNTGLLRLEGNEYIVKDGDVLVIRHS